jgi:phage baseplate assembly protein W
MANDYLQLPIRTGLIIAQNNLKRCSLSESVCGMIHLIILTHFGENKHDGTFGNELWDHDFETIDNIHSFKEQISESLKKAVILHEKRLTDVKVNIAFEQALTTVYNRRIKQKIQISIDGTLCKTNEQFSFREMFFTGPLSYY